MAINVNRYVTITEGAALCGPGGSVDTIKLRCKAGDLPSARQQAGDTKGTWEFQLTDLVALGLLDPSTLPDEPTLDDLLPKSRAERDLQAVRQELQLTRLKLEAAGQALERADREATHYRRIAENLSKIGGNR